MPAPTPDARRTEYALRGLDKPIGVSTFELTRALPPSLQSALPSIDEIEAEMSDKVVGDVSGDVDVSRSSTERGNHGRGAGRIGAVEQTLIPHW